MDIAGGAVGTASIVRKPDCASPLLGGTASLTPVAEQRRRRTRITRRCAKCKCSDATVFSISKHVYKERVVEVVAKFDKTAAEINLRFPLDYASHAAAANGS